MDEVERMLIRQRQRIQRLHQVPYDYDSLEPHFHKELRAYFKKWRCWTTRARYGFVDVDNLSQEHPSHVTVDPEPQPAPDPNPNPSNSTTPTPHPSSHHHDFGHASLHTTIRSLSINRGNIPPTLVNSPISPFDAPHNQNLNLNMHADPPSEPNSSLNSNTSMHATQENHNHNSLHEMWVNGIGPFLMNGELREATGSYLAIETDSETVVLFNLDRRNDNRPKWLRGDAWERGQIPESLDGLNNPVVNREERDRLRVAVRNMQRGPSSISASGSAQYQSPIQNMHELHTIPNLIRSVSLDMGLDVIRNSEVFDTASSHSSSTSAKTDPSICGPSKRRFGIELGRIGRSIRQKLLCGSFSKEGIVYSSLNQNCLYNSCHITNVENFLCNPNGCWEASPNQLFQQQ
nr:hypothetical protein CFP56_56168 [Quercus suber]